MMMRGGLALLAGLAVLAAVFVFPQNAAVRQTATQAPKHSSTKTTPVQKTNTAPAKSPPAATKPVTAATVAKASEAHTSSATSAHGKASRSSAAAANTSFAPAGSVPATAIRQAARNFVLAEVTGNATLYCSLLTSQAQVAISQQSPVSAGTPLETCEAEAGALLSNTAQPDTLSRYDELIEDAPIVLHGDTALMQIGSQSAELQLVDGTWLFSEVL